MTTFPEKPLQTDQTMPMTDRLSAAGATAGVALQSEHFQVITISMSCCMVILKATAYLYLSQEIYIVYCIEYLYPTRCLLVQLQNSLQSWENLSPILVSASDCLPSSIRTTTRTWPETHRTRTRVGISLQMLGQGYTLLRCASLPRFCTLFKKPW